jgi:phosphoadenosine phosphosulfate reductase
MNIEKEKAAIRYLKSFEPPDEPYYLCYSGGKDSDAIRILASLAGVKHDIVNNHTTVDAPETVRYIRSIPSVQIQYPEKSMWELIVQKKGPPSRLMRYCCEELKEKGGRGRVKITGVRWDESANRSNNHGRVTIIGKNKTVRKVAEDNGADFMLTAKGGVVLNTDNAESRKVVETCYRTTTLMVNPIVDWTTEDVWLFLRHYGCESNPLYQCGFKRIGCIGCPLGGVKSMNREFALYPKYKQLYIKAFDRMLLAREAAGRTNHAMWTDGEGVMRWWLQEDANQYTFFDEEEI